MQGNLNRPKPRVSLCPARPRRSSRLGVTVPSPSPWTPLSSWSSSHRRLRRRLRRSGVITSPPRTAWRRLYPGRPTTRCWRGLRSSTHSCSRCPVSRDTSLWWSSSWDTRPTLPPSSTIRWAQWTNLGGGGYMLTVLVHMCNTDLSCYTLD